MSMSWAAAAAGAATFGWEGRGRAGERGAETRRPGQAPEGAEGSGDGRLVRGAAGGGGAGFYAGGCVRKPSVPRARRSIPRSVANGQPAEDRTRSKPDDGR